MGGIFDLISEFYFHQPANAISVVEKPTQYQFNYRQILLLINLIYTIPSFYIYSKCRKLLRENSNNHFNTIFSNDFHINVALFIIDIISTRLPISGLINNYPSFLPSGYFLTIIYFLSYYLIYANYFSSTLICLNRMTSVIYISSNFWQRHTKQTIIIIYILSLIPTWQMLTYDAFFYTLIANDSRYQMIYNTTIIKIYIRNSSSLATISLILAIICIIFNIITILKYRQTIQKSQSSWMTNSKQKQNRRIELTMLIVAIIACSSLILQCAIQILIMVFTEIPSIRGTAQDMRNFCLDISICGPPWVLYFSSISSRNKIGSISEINSRITK
ncbi:unnamed protein product [Caenorhabditis angaria]|uniref:Serpentine receptor class gamma n=1 Tax=Caenorhabditis angaria TaxID=860376 RepID=A0A9P1IGK3_9PELO|nr:unnamed protein product [Caenorhabditis angaria]